MTQVTRVCPICASSNALPRFMNTMAALDGLDMSYRVAICAKCGFVFADLLPPPSSYAAYYRSLSKYDIPSGSSSLSDTDRLRSEAAIKLLQTHISFDARIADLGCGSGMLLSAFSTAGWSNLEGIDPAPGAPKQALLQHGLDCVRCGTLEQAPSLIDLSVVDLVCLTGVLEHLPKLRQDVQALITAVGKHTHLLIEVPALERCAHKPFEPFGEFSLEHVQFFTAASLTRFFESLGYRALSLTLIGLPTGDFDSILGLFVRNSDFIDSNVSLETHENIDRCLSDYIISSESLMQSSMMQIRACPASELLIYCAGSCTARLLPRLLSVGESRLVGLVDNNTNLHGKYLGPFPIESTDAIDRYPCATMIVSSFRSQGAISDALRASHQNPVLELFEDAR